MYKIAILSIGDELCIGQVVNTNASWIAAECSRIGAMISAHSVIGDSIGIVKSELSRLLEISDMVITTGGLGPTHDDITKTALCEFFDDKLELYEPTLEFIAKLSASRGLDATERNKSQAYLPSTCLVLPNKRGTAPGMMFEKNGKIIISLPGVPAEMKGIISEFALPKIEKLTSAQKRIRYKTLQTTGIAESDLADLIGSAEEFLDGGTLAFLPSYQGVRLRIGVNAQSSEEAEKKINHAETIIKARAGKYIFGEGDDALASVAAKLLIAREETIAVAESCTGGMLGAALTDVPGSSAFFPGGIIAYSNEVKQLMLGVKIETLDNYGAVSAETVVEMSSGIRERFNTTYGIAISGIAGPGGGSHEKPVGIVWIAFAHPNGVISRKFIFLNDRKINRERAVGSALGMLVKFLREV